jgi:hypothetical protein
MPSAANPISDLVLFTPQSGEPHPMVQLPSNLSSGFTLNLSPQGIYELSFSNGMAPSTNNNHATARVYLAAFSTTAANPIYTVTASVPPNIDRMVTIVKIQFTVAQVLTATAIWVGSWWDDGTYPDSRDGAIAYFTNHPSGEGHHTVTIIPG